MYSTFFLKLKGIDRKESSTTGFVKAKQLFYIPPSYEKLRGVKMEESITQPIAKTKSLLYMYSTFFFEIERV